MTDTNNEIDITARTIYGEDRGGGEAGMSAVADAIANRVAIARLWKEHHAKEHPLFGDGTFADCCTREWQFSCWNKNDPNCARISCVTTADPAFALAVSIAEKAVNGTLIDSTQGATHYYAKTSEPPYWAKGKTPCADIGGQLFFNNI